MVQMKNVKTRLDRDAWLAAALDLLREQGVDAVRVEPLAARLGVTKGSFYWHFQDRKDLLQSLPLFWAERQTGPVLAHGAAATGGPVAKLRAVAEFLGREDPDRYDNALRAWAQFDDAVAETVQAIDQRRLAFSAGLFEAAGLAPDEAATRARMFYFFDVGGQITGDVPQSEAERRRRSLRRVELLTADLE
jgi:AcrR family transcriptional regulator